MVQSDPEQERLRLAELYSHQTDEELQAIAAQAYELTELARTLLRGELAKRGLTVPVLEYPPGDEVEIRRRVTIRQFRDLPEALLAKGSLDSAEIESDLVDDNIVRLDWFWSNLMGGVKLQVDPEDAEAANEILNQPILEGFDAAGPGQYRQPRCPNCDSLDVSYQELNKPVSYFAAYVGVPIPVYRRAWRCHSCHAQWENDAAPDGTESST